MGALKWLPGRVEGEWSKFDVFEFRVYCRSEQWFLSVKEKAIGKRTCDFYVFHTFSSKEEARTRAESYLPDLIRLAFSEE